MPLTLFKSLGLFLAVSRQDIHQRDGRILHIVYQRVDLRNDIVVEQLKNNRSDKTHEGRQKGDLDTACNEGRADIAGSLDGVERRDHADNGTHEAQHGRKGDEQADPRQARLHLAGLNRTVGNDSLLDRIQTLIVTVETLVVDRSDRAARVAANFLGSFDAAVLQGFFNLGDEFLRVDRRQPLYHQDLSVSYIGG